MNKYLYLNRILSRQLYLTSNNNNSSGLRSSIRSIADKAASKESENRVVKDFAEEELKTPSESDFNLTPEAEEQAFRQSIKLERIERLRNVARLKTSIRNKHHQIIPDFSQLKTRKELEANPKYFRKVYATFGKETGIDPGVIWPHKLELEKIIREEKEYDLTLEQKIDIFIQRKTEEFEQNKKW